MYLVVAGLSNEDDINTAKYVSICTNKKPSVAIRYAANLTSKGLYDNAFVFELHKYGICVLQTSYVVKEKK